MEKRTIGRTLSQRIKGRVDETDGWFAIENGPLVDQRRKAGPEWRGNARAANRKGAATIGEQPGVIGIHRHIWKIAIGS